MKKTVEYLPAYRLAYKRSIGPYGSENAKVMAELKDWAKERDILNEGVVFGIPQDNPEETELKDCRYDAAIVIDCDFVLDDEVIEGEFTEGWYTIFRVEHTAAAVSQAWQEIGAFLAEQEVVLFSPIVERYRSACVARHMCEICVPIVKG